MIEWHPNDEILLEWARNDGMTMWWIGYWLGMTEWWWNEMGLGIKGFALDQEYHIISHHFVIPHHSWMTKLHGVKWKWFLNDISPLWFSILVIPDILKWPRNGGMRRNGRVLEGKLKTEFWDTCHSAIIWSFRSHSNKNLSSHPSLGWQLKASKDGMTFEWWNDIGMTILAQRDTITLDPPLCQQCAKNLWFSLGWGGLGLLLPWSLTNSGLWPHTPNVYITTFTHTTCIWHSNDGMIFKWWNDIQMMEWYSNDEMTFKWWNDTQMMEWHLNDEIRSEWAWNGLFWHKWILIP